MEILKIVWLSLGSIAAEMATALESSFIQSLMAMVIYALATVIISYVTSHSLKARNKRYKQNLFSNTGPRR